jgi:hypothetical protein
VVIRSPYCKPKDFRAAPSLHTHRGVAAGQLQKLTDENKPDITKVSHQLKTKRVRAQSNPPIWADSILSSVVAK